MASELSRRQMIIVSALAAAAFTPLARALGAAPPAKGPVDAGELSTYSKDAIYPQFQPQGFFVVRQGDRIYAESSLCTHKGCKLTPNADGFICKCHGSTFSIDGKVTKAPARRDLPRYAVSKSDNDHLIVDTSTVLDPAKTAAPGAYVDATPAK